MEPPLRRPAADVKGGVGGVGEAQVLSAWELPEVGVLGPVVLATLPRYTWVGRCL